VHLVGFIIEKLALVFLIYFLVLLSFVDVYMVFIYLLFVFVFAFLTSFS